MKQILLYILLSTSIFALEIDEFSSHMGYMRDYNTALELAKKENKPLMLVVGTDYCPWCRKFERKTLKYSEVALKVNQDFIAIIVDKNKDRGNYPNKYASPITPSVFFINPHDNSTINNSVGYIRKKDYLEKLEGVLFVFDKEEIKWERYF